MGKKDNKNKVKLKKTSDTTALITRPASSDNSVFIENVQPATVEQIIELHQILDKHRTYLNSIVYHFIPATFLKMALEFLIRQFNLQDEESIQHNQTRDLLDAVILMSALVCVMTGSFSFKKLMQESLNFLPYMQFNNLQLRIEELHTAILSDQKIKARIAEQQKKGWHLFISRTILSSGFYYISSRNLLDFGVLMFSDDVDLSSYLMKYLIRCVPILPCYEIIYQGYKYVSYRNDHEKHFQVVKQWSNSNLWQETKSAHSNDYYFDLSFADPKELVQVSLNDCQFQLPVKIFMRELATAFLKMGCPVIFFSDTRLVMHDWQEYQIQKDYELHLLNFNKNLLLWHKIYHYEESKLKQLNYISNNLHISTHQNDLQWQKFRYKTENERPAVYFSVDVTGIEEKNIQILLTNLKRLYGKNKITQNEQYIIVDDVKVLDKKIEIDYGYKGKTIPEFEMQSTPTFYSTSLYRFHKDSTENNNNNNNVEESPIEKPEAIDVKVLRIKSIIETHYPNHLVVPLNVPRKHPGREVAIVNKKELSEAMKGYPHSYTCFVTSFENNTVTVKSNNRGNGSSTKGMVRAIEPFRSFEGQFEIAKYKYKMPNNTRVFFQPVLEKIKVDDEDIDIVEARGFNSHYHS